MDKKYLNIKEASELLGVSKLTLRNWDKAGKLLAQRHPINNYRVYLALDLEQLLKKIVSGERPIKYTKKNQEIEQEKSKFYKVKVIHIPN